LKDIPYSPPPPRAELKVSQAALERISQENSKVTSPREAMAQLQAIMENVAEIAATAERKFPNPVNPEVLAVEFYNAMANQEFYPHLPSLLGDPRSPAYGGHHIALDLSAKSGVQEHVLAEAQKIWKQEGSVTFRLDPSDDNGFTQESFETFLDATEKAILDLPESVEIPKMVGIQLSSDDSLAFQYVRSALSGKYYPKFSFTLNLSKETQKGLLSSQEANSTQSSTHPLDNILREIWRKSEPAFFLGEKAGPGSEYPRHGGGPALASQEICHLGSLNVGILAAGNDVDWAKLRRMVRSAVHFLDNLFEVTEFPTEEVARNTLGNRKIGLGIMGFAELLIKLGYPYDHEDTDIIAEKTHAFYSPRSASGLTDLCQGAGSLSKFQSFPLEGRRGFTSQCLANGGSPGSFFGFSCWSDAWDESHRDRPRVSRAKNQLSTGQKAHRSTQRDQHPAKTLE